MTTSKSPFTITLPVIQLFLISRFQREISRSIKVIFRRGHGLCLTVPPESVECEAAGLYPTPTLTPTYPPPLGIEIQSSTWVTQAIVDEFCARRHSFSPYIPPYNRKISDETTMPSVHVPNPFKLLNHLIDFDESWYEPCHLTTHRRAFYFPQSLITTWNA
jgi:hypothetical protein